MNTFEDYLEELEHEGRDIGAHLYGFARHQYDVWLKHVLDRARRSYKYAQRQQKFYERGVSRFRTKALKMRENLEVNYG